MKVPAAAVSIVTVCLLASAVVAESAGVTPGTSTVGQARHTSGSSLSPRAARSALKSARTAMHGGRLVDALKGYESVLASPASASDSRAEALYWAGMLRLSADPTLRDIDRARAYLGELKVFHAGSGRQDEAGIVLALTEELGELRRSAEVRRDERETAKKDAEACRSEHSLSADRLRALANENEALKESDTARRAEIQGLRDEIRRKDEALKKVKEVVVGWKTPR